MQRSCQRARKRASASISLKCLCYTLSHTLNCCRQAHVKELPDGLDTSKYIASGLVAFDLRTRIVKWSTHLDLSTDSTTFRAYAYSAPTLADIDRDGKLEVIAGTSVVRQGHSLVSM